MTQHPANQLFHALANMRAAALRLPPGTARNEALDNWAAADCAENRRKVADIRERNRGPSSAGELDYDGDLERNARDDRGMP